MRGARGYKQKASVKAAIERAKKQGRTVTARDLQPRRGNGRDLVRRGGARPGSGPKKGPPSIPWNNVRDYAESGSSLEDIINGTKLLKLEWLENAATMEELKRVVAEGNATFRLKLRQNIKDKAFSLAEGSASTLALLARNDLGFDKQTPDIADAPDVANIDARLDEIIDKLSKQAGNAK